MITPRPSDPNAAAHERVYRTLRQFAVHDLLAQRPVETVMRGKAGIGRFGGGERITHRQR